MNKTKDINKYLKDFSFPMKDRILNSINQRKEYTLNDLSNMTQGEFLRNFNLGRKSLKTVRELLLKHDLDFKGERIFV